MALEMKIPGHLDSFLLFLFELLGFQANVFIQPLDGALYPHPEGLSGTERRLSLTQSELPVSQK
jgi:hypothetical protein